MRPNNSNDKMSKNYMHDDTRYFESREEPLCEFELIALIFSVFIANRVANDGESNWMEGVQLIAVYAIIAASFFIL